MVASTQASAPRLKTIWSRTIQFRLRAMSRLTLCTASLTKPPARGFTEPMDAIFACAASRAWTIGIRSATGTLIGTVPPESTTADVSGYWARTRSRMLSTMARSSAIFTSSSTTFGLAPTGRDGGLQAAAWREFAHYFDRSRFYGGYDVFQETVDDVFVEDA